MGRSIRSGGRGGGKYEAYRRPQETITELGNPPSSSSIARREFAEEPTIVVSISLKCLRLAMGMVVFASSESTSEVSRVLQACARISQFSLKIETTSPSPTT